MTIWILHPSLTAEEESHIEAQTHLALPFKGLPDLSMIGSEIECRHLLQALHPDDPPEAIQRKTERVWRIYAALQPEDIIAVPLQHHKKIALAEVTQRYRYGVGVSGDDIHQVGVKWYPKRIKFSVLNKYKELLDDGGSTMVEVINPQARIAIRDRLPHSYNRFVKWKWLLALFFVMGMISRFRHLLGIH